MEKTTVLCKGGLLRADEASSKAPGHLTQY
jgi:hypothetical protein